MNMKMSYLSITVFIFIMIIPPAYADTLVLKNDDAIECTIQDERPDAIVVVTEGGLFSFHRSEIKEIKRVKNSMQEQQKLSETRRVEQTETNVKRKKQAEEKLKRMTVPQQKKAETNGDTEKIQKRIKLDIRKSKEERSGWGRIKKAQWKRWGEEE